MRDLFPHQERALQYAQAHPRAALFMEMRLGKTLVVIRWAQGRKILVVAPLTVLPGWVEELRTEGVPDSNIVMLAGHPHGHKLAMARDIPEPGRNWYLINYEGLRVCPELADVTWDTIICDESTRLRNPKAQITKLLTRKFSNIEHRAILSGLPAPEGPMDYFTQMQFLHGAFLGTSNYWAFRERFFHADMRGWDWVPNPGTIEKIKQEVHRQSFVLTRQQAGMGNRKIYEKRVVEMTPEIKRYQKQVLKDFRFEGLETKWSTVQAVWLARLAGGFSPDQENPRLISDTKIREVIELAKGELSQQKLVVWFRFNEELHATRNALLSAGLGPVGAMTGATDPADRHRLAMAFGKGQFPLLLMQEQIGKFGINLSAASAAIYYSNWWEYETRAQSEDRLEHLQKHEPLLYIDLITKGSTDNAVVDALRDKKLTSRTFMMQLVANLAAEWRAYGIEGATPETVPAPAQPVSSLRARVRRVQSRTRQGHS